MSGFRKSEYFNKQTTSKHNSVGNIPLNFYIQETDWTCSVACIRTLISKFEPNLMSEKEFVEKYNLKPGPHYSEQIKQYKILDKYDAIYGCDNKDIELDDIITYMEQGYYVMLESMINYSHWLVLLNYLTIPTPYGYEGYQLVFYDPYYNNIRMMNADEFIGVWLDGSHEKTNIKKDFIAVKAK